MADTSFGLVFGGLGVLMDAIAVSLFIRKQKFRSIAVQSAGLVTQLRTSRDEDGGTVYAPDVQFRTQTGAMVTYQAKVFTRPCKYTVGDPVEILYDPKQPERAEIKGRLANDLLVWLLGGVGLTFTVIGGVVLRGGGQ